MTYENSSENRPYKSKISLTASLNNQIPSFSCLKNATFNIIVQQYNANGHLKNAFILL